MELSIFTSLRGLISNSRKSSPAESVTEEVSPCSPVTALCAGDLIDGPTMLDLVVRVESVGDTVHLTTNSRTTEHHESDTVHAMRRVKHSRTGDWHLVPVR